MALRNSPYDRARRALLADLLLLPGLGALTSGRRLWGLAQAGLALTGFGLTLLWLASYGLSWLQAGENPCDVLPGLLALWSR